MITSPAPLRRRGHPGCCDALWLAVTTTPAGVVVVAAHGSIDLGTRTHCASACAAPASAPWSARRARHRPQRPCVARSVSPRLLDATEAPWRSAPSCLSWFDRDGKDEDPPLPQPSDPSIGRRRRCRRATAAAAGRYCSCSGCGEARKGAIHALDKAAEAAGWLGCPRARRPHRGGPRLRPASPGGVPPRRGVRRVLAGRLTRGVVERDRGAHGAVVCTRVGTILVSGPRPRGQTAAAARHADAAGRRADGDKRDSHVVPSAPVGALPCLGKSARRRW
jgi:hypothetical protein